MDKDSQRDWPVGPGRSGLNDPYWVALAQVKERLQAQGRKVEKDFELQAEKTARKARKK